MRLGHLGFFSPLSTTSLLHRAHRDTSFVLLVSPFLQSLLKLKGLSGQRRDHGRKVVVGRKIKSRCDDFSKAHLAEDELLTLCTCAPLDTLPAEMRLEAVLDSDQVTHCLRLHKL